MKQRKKIALMTLPALALLLLGGTTVSAHHGRMLDESQKAAMSEARELRRNGEPEVAKEVLLRAGLSPEMRGHRSGKGMMHDAETRELIHTALAENDYDAFLAAVADTPFAAIVTEERFAVMVKAYQLRTEGKFEEARDLMREEGFGFGRGGVR